MDDPDTITMDDADTKNNKLSGYKYIIGLSGEKKIKQTRQKQKKTTTADHDTINNGQAGI